MHVWLLVDGPSSLILMRSSPKQEVVGSANCVQVQHLEYCLQRSRQDILLHESLSHKYSYSIVWFLLYTQLGECTRRYNTKCLHDQFSCAVDLPIIAAWLTLQVYLLTNTNLLVACPTAPPPSEPATTGTVRGTFWSVGSESLSSIASLSLCAGSSRGGGRGSGNHRAMGGLFDHTRIPCGVELLTHWMPTCIDDLQGT